MKEISGGGRKTKKCEQEGLQSRTTSGVCKDTNRNHISAQLSGRSGDVTQGQPPTVAVFEPSIFLLLTPLAAGNNFTSAHIFILSIQIEQDKPERSVLVWSQYERNVLRCIMAPLQSKCWLVDPRNVVDYIGQSMNFAVFPSTARSTLAHPTHLLILV